MSKTTSSRLRHRLTLQQEIRTLDDSGGYVRSWQDIADLWAEIIPITGGQLSSKGSGKEISFAGQLQAEISHRILLRYRDGITADMRLLFQERAFNICSVASANENKEVLELLVQEGVAA